MSSYEHFASIYDIFMDNIPYREWADRIISIIRECGALSIPKGDEALASEARLLVDLGCGTGVMTRLMKDAGFDCIGIDLSYEMLETAMAYNESPGQSSITSEDGPSPDASDSPDILYLCQDMREFELYSTVGYIISVCDSINYLLTEEDVIACFKLVNNYLYPGGLFIFDFNTVYNYESIGDSTIAENRPEGSFIWENYYDPETHINEYDLTLYIREDLTDPARPGRADSHTIPNTGDHTVSDTYNHTAPDTDDPLKDNTGDPDIYDQDSAYIRSQETHVQRGYTLDEMLGFLERSGLQVIKYIDSDTGGEVTEETSRILMVSKENTKWIN